jgi:HEAT repeat protein
VITVLAASHSTATANVLGLIFALVGSVAGVAATVFAGLGLRRSARPSEEIVSQKTLEDRLEELSKSMRNSAKIVEQVSAELDVRAATAKKLKEEADAAQALAEVNKDQVDAIRRLMDTELEGTARRIRRDSIVIGIASFITGGGISFLITLLVHPLH